MQQINNPPKSDWEAILTRPMFETENLQATVQSILTEVKLRGDAAVLAYEAKFDNVTLSSLLVSDSEWEEADQLVDKKLKVALQQAKQNIEKFHLSQQHLIQKIETSPGVVCWQKAVAIQKVGLYIPGGSAPLFSTVLMLAIPAQIAGCKEIVLCTPPNIEGKIHPAILYAAKLAGVHTVFKIGGVQAIAAMAYGTQSVPKVYKIVGPGNQYVTTAKQLVSLKEVAIDMPAGPSEVAVIADKTANPLFVASDLLSQAEHGADSQAILISTDQSLIDQVVIEIEAQKSVLPRYAIIEKALQSCKLILVKTMEEAVEMVNEYAPEHLIIACEDYLQVSEQITQAGSVFLGHYTPESAGDYASGTNHTLPTNGYAKAYSGVNLDSFVKKITFQEITKQGIQSIGETIQTMAEQEGLEAHKHAVTVRLK